MINHKAKIRIGWMVFLIVCVILCPLAWGSYSVHYAAHAQDKRDDPIEFTPHVTAIVLTVTPEPVLEATVAPGQYFEEDDEEQLPEVARPDLLEYEEFGYSAILGEEGLYLVWSTDDHGYKHYYILDQEDGFFQRIKTTVDDNIEARRTLDETNPLFSLIWAGTKVAAGEVGIIICGVATITSIKVPPLAGFFGACTLGAVGLFGSSLDEYFDIANSVRAYERRTEEDRLAIEGIFREVGAASSP